MKKLFSSVLIAVGCLCSCSQAPKDFQIQFDNTKEVSGQKFALKDVSPGLPADWDGYNYVVVEFKISTAQRFHIGFTTATG